MKGISNYAQGFKDSVKGDYHLEMKGISNCSPVIIFALIGDYHLEMKGISNEFILNKLTILVIIILK